MVVDPAIEIVRHQGPIDVLPQLGLMRVGPEWI
jgi:hypothetical protein